MVEKSGGTQGGTDTPGAGDEAGVVRGCCHVYHALDVGFAVDLKRCAGLIQEARAGSGFHNHARTPPCLTFRPLPIHLSQSMQPICGATFRTAESLTLTIYDFGAVSVQYRVPFAGTLEQIAAISSELCENKLFAADARTRAEALVAAIYPAVRRPKVRDEIEDYLVFVIPEAPEGPGDPERFVAEHRHALAQILNSDALPLAVQQQRQDLSSSIAYHADDLTIITWNAALVFGRQMDDVLTLLELANVQLRELHYLDDQLDASLQETYEVQGRVVDVKAQMRRIRELMLDGQAFSEAVTNAFKPFPDAFLARLYGLASGSLGLNHFDQSIKDKLNLLNTLYTTLSDEAAHSHSVRLEWIVIVLILFEIIMGLSEKVLPLFWRH